MSDVAQREELERLEKEIELKRQELEKLRVEEEGKTDRVVVGGLLACLGVALAVAGSAAAAAVEQDRKRTKRGGWF